MKTQNVTLSWDDHLYENVPMTSYLLPGKDGADEWGGVMRLPRGVCERLRPGKEYQTTFEGGEWARVKVDNTHGKLAGFRGLATLPVPASIMDDSNPTDDW